MRYTNYPKEPIAEGELPSKPVWVFEASERITSTPVFSDGRIFIKTDNLIYATDSTNGTEFWHRLSQSYSSPNFAPVVAGDRLIVVEKYSNLSAYRTDSGERLWQAQSRYEGIEDPTLTQVEAMALGLNLVLVARRNHGLTAYSLASGEIVWSVPAPDRTILYLAADTQTVYLAAGRTLLAYDISTGKLRWEKAFPSLVGPILVNDGVLFVALRRGITCLLALDLDAGTLSEKWQIYSGDLLEDEPRTIVIEGDLLLLGGQKLVGILKETGKIQWISQSTGWLERPVVFGDRVYVRNTMTTLFAFDLANGQEKGRLTLQENTPLKHEAERSPVVAGGLLIVPFGDERIFAYSP
ncbi:MAG: PQQ-binding-like beta-propeller repeat protein [Chloroflexota bacterium]